MKGLFEIVKIGSRSKLLIGKLALTVEVEHCGVVLGAVERARRMRENGIRKEALRIGVEAVLSCHSSLKVTNQGHWCWLVDRHCHLLTCLRGWFVEPHWGRCSSLDPCGPHGHVFLITSCRLWPVSWLGTVKSCT